MHRTAIAIFVAALVFGIHDGSVQAQSPSYLVLRGPAAPAPHHASPNRYPGHGIGVTTQAYSYGWFGASPRQHASRHFGYYRNYTQWSAK